jgi:hypothetical protein
LLFFAKVQSTMASNEPKRTGFRIANGPLIRKSDAEQAAIVSEFADLPPISGAPILFAIARDPRTLFTYWNIDWASEFAAAAPLDRQVHLRVITADGTDESETVVEPMLGSYYARVEKPRGNYRVELGYYDQTGAWHSVAISDTVAMPPETASESAVVDVATVPFHLSFQHMIDVFRESSGDELTTAISRLQERASGALNQEEREVLRAMNLSIEDVDAARRAFMQQADNIIVRKRVEAILGFGSTSPAGGFGGSSWS